MSKPATKKAGVKRRRKSGWDIDRRAIEAEWEAALLRIPEEILREEIAFWSWPDSPEGELWFEMSDTLEVLLKDVGLDAKERKFVWPDAGRLDLDKSVRRINQQYPEFPEDQITEFLVFWIRSLYVPEGCSDSQMEELERLTERWVADLGMAEN
ncbi:MAG TPA: hypothetical protein VKB49_29305 [Candidatus Sulfotelmatobacter sp.]|nr:hypothetical protein [Candidatus Sulfotelmatobacter sp.]